jgi:hypothetical protein
MSVPEEYRGFNAGVRIEIPPEFVYRTEGPKDVMCAT